MKKKAVKKAKPAKFTLAEIRPAKLTFIASMILALVLQSVPMTHVAQAAAIPNNKVDISSDPFILGTDVVATVDGAGQQAGAGSFSNGSVTNYPEGACLPFNVTVSHDHNVTGDVSLAIVYDYTHPSTDAIGIEDVEKVTPLFSGNPDTNADNLSDFTFNLNAFSNATSFNTVAGTTSATVTGPFADDSGTTAIAADDRERHYNVVLPNLAPNTEVFIALCARLGVDASDFPGASMSVQMGSGSGAQNTAINPSNLLKLPSLTLTKVVSSGTADPDEFSFVVAPAIDGEDTFDIADGQTSVTILNISPNGVYSITETGPAGYSFVSGSGTSCTFTGETASATVAAGDPATDASCTFTNAADASGLTVTKIVTNDDGGTLAADAFSFHVNGGPAIPFEADGTNQVALNPGTYTITESGPAGYAQDFSACGDGSITIDEAEQAVCTIENDDIAPTLRLVKFVINDDAGALDSSNWSLAADGLGGFSDLGNSTTFHPVSANQAHALTESAVPGYTLTGWLCNGGVLANDAITLGLAENVTCTATNDDNEVVVPTGTLIIQKEVINDNDGLSNAEDFSFQVNGGPAIAFEADGENQLTLDVGTYTVTEVAASGYTPSFENCDQITVPANGTVTCVITNDDDVPPPPIPGSIIVVKEVVGGTLSAGDFTMIVTDDLDLEVASFPGQDAGTEVPVDPGTYTVSETQEDGYAVTFSASCPDGVVTIAEGESATCTLTNTFQVVPEGSGLITVVKVVDGGDAEVTDFLLFVDETAVVSGEQNEFSPGTYTISEENPEEFPGYTATFSQSCTQGQLLLGDGDVVTCTITNTFTDPDPDPVFFTLSLTTNGDGHGRVEGQLEDIDCDTDTEEDNCSHQYEEGTVVTITAVPDEGSNFDSSWSGACSGNNPVCQVTMSANMNVNAHFALNAPSNSGGGGGGGGGCGTCGVLPAGALTFPTTTSPTLPPGQVLGLVDEVPSPTPQVLGDVDELPVTGVPVIAIGLMLTPLLWALRRKE